MRLLLRHRLAVVTGDPAALRALLAEVTASALGTGVPPGHPDPVTDRLLRPDFTRWQAHAARTRGCTRPVRLRGWSLTIHARTGEVVETFDTDHLPDAILYKPCGTRRESVCPACAEVYRWDAYHLIAAGLRGGKGVPASVCEHPATFLTLTPPSFGAVHTRPDRTGRPGTGRPRLDPCRGCQPGRVGGVARLDGVVEHDAVVVVDDLGLVGRTRSVCRAGPWRSGGRRDRAG